MLNLINLKSLYQVTVRIFKGSLQGLFLFSSQIAAKTWGTDPRQWAFISLYGKRSE
jgi:hypothetical protein